MIPLDFVARSLLETQYREAKARGDARSVDRLGNLLGLNQPAQPASSHLFTSFGPRFQPSKPAPARANTASSPSSQLEEKELAEKLKMLRYEDNDDALRQQLSYCKELGDIYAKKGVKESIVQAAGLYNYALQCARRINDGNSIKELFEKLADLEAELIKVLLVDPACICIAFVSHLFQRAQGDFTFADQNRINQEKLRKIRDEIDIRINNLGKEPSPEQIKGVFQFTTSQMKGFTADLFVQAIKLLGPPPCKYAVIGLGSMAREEMTHYSDLEFAILIEEGSAQEIEQRQVYFEDLTYLLHLKVINLGETILPALNIPCLKQAGFFDGLTPRGFAFDGAGVQGKGCKTPLGNGTTFKLIQTPSKMAQYLTLDRTGTGIDWPQKEPQLPMEILNFTLIMGERSLHQDYQIAIQQELNRLYRTGITLRSYLAQEHLRSEDENRFDPARDLHHEGRIFNVKQDLYRFPHLAIDRLALLFNIKEYSTFERIKKLHQKKLLRAEAAKRLYWLISEVMFQRLRAYSYYKAQREFMNPLLKIFDIDKTIVKNQFSLDKDSLIRITKIYQVLLPFHLAIQQCLNGDLSQLQNGLCWVDDPISLGKISARLLQWEQAKRYYLEAYIAFSKNVGMLIKLGLLEHKTGNNTKALKYLADALEIFNKTPEKEAHIEATILNCLGVVNSELGHYQTALSHHKEALRINEGCGKEQLDLITDLCNVGAAHHRLGEYRTALSFYERARLIAEKNKFGTESPILADIFNGIGNAYTNLEDNRQALVFFERALEVDIMIYGVEHPTGSIVFNNIGNSLCKLGDYQLASSVFKMALQIREKFFGKWHSDVANSLNDLGAVHHKLGYYPEAISLYQEALEIQKKCCGSEHPVVATSLNNIGIAYHGLKRYELALFFFQKALSILIKKPNPSHTLIATIFDNVGEACRKLKAFEEALFFRKIGFVIRWNIYGPESPSVANSLSGMALVYHALGRKEEAIACFKRAMIIESRRNPNILRLLDTLLPSPNQ